MARTRPAEGSANTDLCMAIGDGSYDVDSGVASEGPSLSRAQGTAAAAAAPAALGAVGDSLLGF